MAQVINSLIKLAIFFGILYLIFTNFTTFLIILFVIFAIGYYAFAQLKKKIRQHQSNSFKFTFNGQDFGSNGANFDFRDFQEQFNSGNYNSYSSFGEVNQAKEFFGFTHEPTKDEIKKRYKELARKYHPDLNDQDDTLMQQLNHYKDVLLKAYAN
jgi:hypothetical protein